jgi:multidrug resistance efflux pump
MWSGSEAVMEILLTLTYVAICIAVFKILRIPINQWTLATTGLGGIVGLSLLFITMYYNHPSSSNARFYFAVTPVLPTVKGRVVEVPVEPNTPLRKGDVLFRIDTSPYQYIVDQKKAALAEAEQADEERTRLASPSQIGEVNTQVARLQAELSDAQYDLNQTVVRAPDNGFVTQIALTPGVYVEPAPFRPAMTFVNTDPQKRALGAAFQQNALQRVRAGGEAEIAFKAVPGRVFKGRVRILLDATAGQMQASGTLQDFGAPTAESIRGMALIDILDDISLYQIPVGSAAEVAIYTDHFKGLSLLRRILLRMRGWENYIFLESL